MYKFTIRFSRKDKVNQKVFPSKLVTVIAENKHDAYNDFLRRMELFFPESSFLITSIKDESGCYVYMMD